MGDILRKPYEISIWEDILVTENEVTYYTENKIAVIGSDTMDSPNKVYDPVLHKNLNGEVTLTFSLKYKYFDPQVQKMVTNPFEGYLINERKVKLCYDSQWYDFIIRNHEESNEEYTWTYTCQDAFVLELSKNGYNVELDDSLGNNQGTAAQLAKTVLKDTDWTVDEEHSDILKQLIEEPVYTASLGLDLEDIDILNVSGDGEPVPKPGSKICVFYSYVTGEDGDFVQFIQPFDSDDFIPVGYSGLTVPPDGDSFVILTDELKKVDDLGNVIATNFRINTPLYFDDSDGQKTFKADINEVTKTVITIHDLETKYHAYRLVYNQLTTYDPVMERTVDILNVAPEDIAYRYTDYIYSTSDVVLSYVTNGENFEQYNDGSVQGWSEFTDSEDFCDIGVSVYPKINESINLLNLGKFAQSEGFLRIKFPATKTIDHKNTVFNSGIEDNTSLVDSIARGQKFVLRWRAGMADSEDAELIDITKLGDNQIGAIVAKYTSEFDSVSGRHIKVIDKNNIILEFDGNEAVLNNIIDTGVFTPSFEQYIIDDVVQTPSSKYIYISADDSSEQPTQYIWDKENQIYIEKTDSFLDYRYLIAEAQKSVSNKEISDANELFGIFIYLRNNADVDKYYFIQDMQLTRYIEDANNIPVIIGNIPLAQAYETEYYYLKPKEGQTQDDIELYTSLEAFARALNVSLDEITLAYNENSEKVLMVTESHSNCFNILQTIAETFECWLKIDVTRDSSGAIALDENYKPIKKVSFKEFSGNKNFAGFRYGINLKSIQRTVDSDEIVTKLIVEPVQSDYTDEGIVSITEANSNSSGESYIFNFNYYYRNGLMDVETIRPKIETYNLTLKLLNNAIKDWNSAKADIDIALTRLNSKRVDYTTLIETAQENINRGKADFKKATGQNYDEYREVDIVEDTYMPTIDTEVIKYRTYYYLEDEEYKPVTNPTGNPMQEGWYIKVLDLLKDEKIVEIIGEIYTNSMMINNYSGLLSNIEKEYNDLHFEAYGAEDYSFTVTVVDDKVRVNVSDYVIPFEFYYGVNKYEVTVNQKSFEFNYVSEYTIHDFTIPTDYNIYTVNDEILSEDIIPDADRIQKFKVIPVESSYSIQREIDEIIKRKEQLTKDFYIHFSRFIQEGTWSSNNYLNSDMYYLDATQVSNVSCQPKVSYSIDVAEISMLAGLENYQFEVGDKTWIEDEEFFGWNPVLKAPTREEVIVSEVEWHLDDPSNNSVKIQNYKTQFEDLFQRINATVQSAQYNDNTYAKTSAIINPDGTLRHEILMDALNGTAGLRRILTSDGSVYIEGDNIYIQNLTNAANRVIINSEGIRVSDDGGLSWFTALSGRGINAETIYTGSIDTDNVTIGGTENPAFRWDKYGLSAFKSDGEGVYDLKTFVRFDEYGLYGIKNSSDYIAEDLDDIKRKAHFGITWDGFFIKNSYTNGRVEITSDNDFRVMQLIGSTDTERIKIGALEFDADGAPTKYGIRINNENGEPVFNTGSDGNLSIMNTIRVGSLGPNDRQHIVIDGENAVIKTSNYSPSGNFGWSIDKNGDAVFNNITARGAIKTAVFEYAEIQAVGGIFMFRPSSTIRSAVLSGDNIVITVDQPLLFSTGDSCKISNYTSEMVKPTDILNSAGLHYVYSIQVNSNSTIVLIGAAEMISDGVITQASELIGGALISMGHYESGITTKNYGIGVNSSDNMMSLPPRAISLFETEINTGVGSKLDVQYHYKGILGTLPTEAILNSPVESRIYQNLSNTQGIFTNNMYIGDADNYVAFYKDREDNQAKLEIKGILHIGDGTLNGAVNIENGGISLGDSEGFHIYINGNKEKEPYTYGLGFYEGSHNPYQLSLDSKVYSDKTYYEYKNTDTIKGYVEVVQYIECSEQETVVVSGVDYYTYDSGRDEYELVENPTGSPYAQNYYRQVPLQYTRCSEEETVVDPEIDYYEYDIATNTYTLVDNPTGSPYEQGYYRDTKPQERGWYEYEDRRIAYINDQKLHIPYTVVLQGMALGVDCWMWELQEDTKNLTLKWMGE